MQMEVYVTEVQFDRKKHKWCRKLEFKISRTFYTLLKSAGKVEFQFPELVTFYNYAKKCIPGFLSIFNFPHFLKRPKSAGYSN